MEFSELIGYRLVAPRWESTALSGEGARMYGGRWNRPGRAVVYLGGSRALAALETLVHLTTPDSRAKTMVLLTVQIPEVMMEMVSANTLMESWTDVPPTAASLQVGERWLNSGKSLGLRVPSMVVSEEWNLLLNPAHRDFTEVKVVSRREFHFDSRF